jgi:hypothetical protein
MPILIEREDGGLSVMQDVPEDQLERNLSEWAKHQALGEGYVSHQVVDAADIPVKDEFRNAWKMNGGGIDHDLTKCKAIAHEQRRRVRAALFAPLDIEATIPARAAEAEAKRQAIRESDALKQAAIDAAKSVEEIKAALS